MKKILSLIVVAGLVFSLGINTYAADDPSDGALPDLTIKKVEVVAGGAEQSVYRDAENYDVSTYTVYKGDHPVLAVNGEEPGKYYTTARNASMTDPRIFTMELAVPADDYPDGIGTGDGQFDVSQLTWRYNGSTLSTGQAGTHTQSAIVRVGSPSAVLSGDYIIVTQDIKFNAFYGASSTTVNRPYAPYYSVTNPSLSTMNSVGDWDLEAYYSGGFLASEMIRLSVNDTFRKWSELEDYVQELREATGGDEGGIFGDMGRYVRVESLGMTNEGRNIWAAIVSDSKASVDHYLNNTQKRMNDDPAGLLAELGTPAGSDTKGVLFFNTIHANEVVGPSICTQLIDRLTNNDSLDFTKRARENTTDILTTSMTSTSAGGTGVRAGSPFDNANLDVDEFLDKYIVLLTFVSNPDGLARMQRGNFYGYDMNRDASYMSQLETRAVARAFAKWDPIYMVEFHGYYSGYIVDGTTPPYEPNFEADLIEDNLLGLCDSIGLSIIGNSAHTRYNTPTRDIGAGWDNGSTIYTPSMSMLFGSLGSTIEFPNSTQDSVDAGVQGMFGLFSYCIDKRDSLINNKVEFKRRGVENLDLEEKVDPCLVNVHSVFIEKHKGKVSFNIPEQEIVGRPRVEGQSFFPEYYIIPSDDVNQRNVPAAVELLQTLEMINVKVGKTTAPVNYGGVTYPVGTYVIDMHQAGRTFANTMLYDGYDASRYGSMYSSVVIGYPDLRGFNSVPVYEKTTVFNGKTVPVSGIQKPYTARGATDYVIIKNDSLDATRLVNRLLSDDNEVYMLTKPAGGASAGDFIAKKADVAAKSAAAPNNFFGSVHLYVKTHDYANTPPPGLIAQPLKQPRIGYYGYATGSSDIRYMLDLLEFNDAAAMTSSSPRANADVFLVYYNSLGSGANSILGRVQSGTPLVYTGNISNFNSVITETADRLARYSGGSGNDVLLRGSVSNSVITPNYEGQDTVYTSSAEVIRTLPSFMKSLATVSNDPDFYKAGWWTSSSSPRDGLKGTSVVAAGVYKGTPLAVFADWVFDKTQAQIYYHMVSNAMIAFANGILVTADDEVALVSAAPSASVTKLNGNQNDLHITVVEKFSDGSENVINVTLKINNNAAGTYVAGGYEVYVDTKGNTQIRECRIVN